MIFKNSKPKPPIEKWMIDWFENSFTWIIYEFGVNTIREKKIIRPVEEDLPVEFENCEETAFKLLPIIANQMNVDYTTIDLMFYQNNSIMELSNSDGVSITLPNDTNKVYSGIYAGINKSGRHEIYLDISKFRFPQSLVATMAHEIAHVILSQKKNLNEYDEFLVDLLPVIFGLGIFNANVSFQFFQSNEGWGYASQGYLRQQDWAYALALYCNIRKEENACNWSKYLVANIEKDFVRSLKYIKLNPFKFWS